MKVSRYTLLFKDDGDNYVYNTLSNAFIKVDDESFMKIRNAQDENLDFSEDGCDQDLFDVLKRKKIITEGDKDDFLMYKSIIQSQRLENNFMHLTLAPTMDCCFRCHYCFEKYKAKTYMSPEVMDSIIKYVSSIDTLKSLYLTWFGGEPLMAIRQIEQFYDKIEPYINGLEYKSNIITTGYHLDDEAMRILQKVKVSSIQITLDGCRETHNKVKHFPGSGDVFERVLNNVERYNDLCPEVNVVFRVNLTRNNAHEYEALQSFISERFKNRDMIAIAPAFVQDRSSIGCKPASALFNHKSTSEYILSLAKKGIDSTYIRYPKNHFYECAIRNNMAISFDPEGYAYKCWEMIGNRKYSIGRLDDNGKLVDINLKLYNRQMYGADPLEDPKCRECKYLPLCNGGCPIHRIENEFDDGINNCCIHYKGYMEEFLKEHIRRRKMGLSNR